MKKFVFIFICMFCGFIGRAQSDTTALMLEETTIVSFSRNTVNTGSLISCETLKDVNYGQEPSHVFKTMPSIFATSDNGTEFGYGYFRIRGLDQTRINVTLDGCPWNEAEDFGTYFANSPDLMSSMNSIKVERGTSASYMGTAGSAGGINLESVNLFIPNESYAYAGAGRYNTYKTSVVYNMTPTDKCGLHIKASTSETEGYRDYGFNNSKAITVKFGYKFNEYNMLDILSVNGYHKNGQGWLGNTIEELEINPRANGCTKDEDDNWFMSMNRLQYKGWFSENLLFISSVYYQGQTGSYRMDLDNYMVRMSDPSWEKTDILYDYALTHNMVGANAIIKAYWKNASVSGGINTYNYNRRHYCGDRGKNVPVEEKYDNNGNKYDFSCFASASYMPCKEFSISGNVQYRLVDFSYKDNVTGIKYNSNNLGTNWNFFNFGVAIETTPIGGFRGYLRYNRVNREPTRSDMFGGYEYYTGELNTKTPEIASDIEVGVEYINKQITVNANFFTMWFENELVLNGEYGLNGLPCHENAGESYRRGIEIILDWNIWSKIHFNNSFSYSDNKVTTETYGKKTHVMTPSFTYNGDLLWKDKIWNAGISFNYRSSMFVDMNNDFSIPDMWTLNFHGAVRINNIELGALVNNMTDRVNYCTGAVGANNTMLYMKNAGITFLGNIKIFF